MVVKTAEGGSSGKKDGDGDTGDDISPAYRCMCCLCAGEGDDGGGGRWKVADRSEICASCGQLTES